MNRRGKVRNLILLGAAISAAGILLAQTTPTKQLVVNGATTGATVLQVDGHYYVDVDTVARITSGAISVEPTRIVLTIPTSAATAPPATASSAASAQPTQELSRGFASAGITALAEMKEWQGTLETMVTYGLAVDAQWAQTNHDRVQASLSQASVAATTNADRDAFRLLSSEFGNLAQWANGVAADRQNFNGARTIDPNRLQNDSALTKISTCGNFLNSMFASGVFSENASCQ
ncbi:MAG: hypothetical protein ABSA32_11585 [Candidatus Acidiferrales bacterium]|jgi:hypothetical protein